MGPLAEPFQYIFFREGFAMTVLAGGLCAIVGTYVVLRGMSYIGHGLSHSVFGGAAASFLIGVNFYLGAGVWGVASALMINRVSRRRTIGADAAIGVITTASFAVGIALISRNRSFTRNFEAALFGNVLGIDTSQVIGLAVVSIAVLATIAYFYRQFLFLTFDGEVAEVFGLRTARLDALFSLVLAATIIASMQVLGVTLIAAALVIPPVSARLITDRFSRMLVLSGVIGAITGGAGIYASFYLDVASGAAVVIAQATVFAILYAASGFSEDRRTRLAGLDAH